MKTILSLLAVLMLLVYGCVAVVVKSVRGEDRNIINEEINNYYVIKKDGVELATFDQLTNKITIRYNKCKELGLDHAWHSYDNGEKCANCGVIRMRRVNKDLKGYHWEYLEEGK